MLGAITAIVRDRKRREPVQAGAREGRRMQTGEAGRESCRYASEALNRRPDASMKHGT
ncbi:hypothetical protein BD311DRAFT_756580 [Dichomitus squalens]|uniref:Uncharacterized protein n=1 Tax=Dichomitus squalens TaxID=114155 RepID=A0A4Q9MPE7_9APHY|nr:hypothetical protein BD311DRAFT_756580 [Dichomitus squalens]